MLTICKTHTHSGQTSSKNPPQLVTLAQSVCLRESRLQWGQQRNLLKYRQLVRCLANRPTNKQTDKQTDKQLFRQQHSNMCSHVATLQQQKQQQQQQQLQQQQQPAFGYSNCAQAQQLLVTLQTFSCQRFQHRYILYLADTQIPGQLAHRLLIYATVYSPDRYNKLLAKCGRISVLLISATPCLQKAKLTNCSVKMFQPAHVGRWIVGSLNRWLAKDSDQCTEKTRDTFQKHITSSAFKVANSVFYPNSAAYISKLIFVSTYSSTSLSLPRQK